MVAVMPIKQWDVDHADETHRAHVRLFDELAADENPELTVNNPLIRDKETD